MILANSPTSYTHIETSNDMIPDALQKLGRALRERVFADMLCSNRGIREELIPEILKG